jgi:hypothetical protein
MPVGFIPVYSEGADGGGAGGGGGGGATGAAGGGAGLGGGDGIVNKLRPVKRSTDTLINESCLSIALFSAVFVSLWFCDVMSVTAIGNSPAATTHPHMPTARRLPIKGIDQRGAKSKCKSFALC